MKEVEFGSLFQFIRNGMSVKQDKSGAGLPISRIETISDATVDASRVGYAGLKEEECGNWLLVPGDILFSHINSVEHVGKCAVYRGVPEKLIHGMNLLCLRSDPVQLIPEFAKYLIRSPLFRSRLSSFINKAVNQASVSIGNLKTIKVSVPSIPDQRRIAAILDQADALRAKRREALAQLDNLSQSIFIDMFEGADRGDKRWRVCTVGDLTDCIVPGRDKPKSFSGAIPWVTTSDLTHLGVTSGSEKGMGLSKQEIETVNARVIPMGSVIISCVGDLGIVSIAGLPMVVNQQLHSFQCHSGLNNVFLMYCLARQKAYMLAKASSTTLPYMNKSVCNSIPIFSPPLEMQKSFASRIQKIETIKTCHQEALSELEKLFSALQQRAFIGEL
jgi:type I restriction enzyme S subunit